MDEKKFILALDFDGVITSPYKLKTKYLNELGHKVSEAESSALSCLKLGISREDHEYATKKAFTTNPKDLPLEKNVLNYLDKLRKLSNIFIVIVTSRKDEDLDHLKEYLKYHNLKVNGIVNTNNKSKTEALTSLRANIFVEDSPFKLMQLKENKELTTRLVLYRNTQNLNEKKSSNEIIEVDNWKDLFEVILQEYKKFSM